MLLLPAATPVPMPRCPTRSVEKEGVYSRGMPAGITTMSAPVKAFFMPSSAGRKPSMRATVEMWERSAVTPGVLTTS